MGIGWGDCQPQKNYQSEKTSLTFRYSSHYELKDSDPRPNEKGYWQIMLTSPLAQHSPKDTSFNDKELRIEIFIAPNNPTKTLTEFFSDHNRTDGNPPGKKSEVTIGGIPAFRSDWEGMGTGTSYYLINSNQQFIITKYPLVTERDLEFNQILSTFKFSNTQDDSVTITFPQPSAVISSPVRIVGEAPKGWSFEANLPVYLEDSQHRRIAGGGVMVQEIEGADRVSFDTSISFPPQTGTGFVTINKDNPSGLPENAGTFSIPVRYGN